MCALCLLIIVEHQMNLRCCATMNRYTQLNNLVALNYRNDNYISEEV